MLTSLYKPNEQLHNTVLPDRPQYISYYVYRPRRHQLSTSQYSASNLRFDLKSMHFSLRDLSLGMSCGIWKCWWRRSQDPFLHFMASRNGKENISSKVFHCLLNLKSDISACLFLSNQHQGRFVRFLCVVLFLLLIWWQLLEYFRTVVLILESTVIDWYRLLLINRNCINWTNVYNIPKVLSCMHWKRTHVCHFCLRGK